MKIKFKQNLNKWKKGQIIEFPTGKFADDEYISRRIEDSKIDGCIEKVKKKKEGDE